MSPAEVVDQDEEDVGSLDAMLGVEGRCGRDDRCEDQGKGGRSHAGKGVDAENRTWR